MPDLDETAARMDAIRARAAAATPGPWGWRGNTDNGDPYLTSLGHRDVPKPDGTVVRHHAGDVLGHIPVELTRADAINHGVGDPDGLPEPKVDIDPIDTYDKRYDAAIEAAREAEIEDYLTDDYGQPRTVDRLAFCTDWLYTDARKLVIFQVAPGVTERSDPRVYRADITGIRHPDAEFIEHSREDLSRLLAAVEAALKLADEYDAESKRLWGQISDADGRGVKSGSKPFDAAWNGDAAEAIRDAIARELTGKAAGDA